MMTLKFYYRDCYMGWRKYSAATYCEAFSWLRNNERYPGAYSVSIRGTRYIDSKALPRYR